MTITAATAEEIHRRILNEVRDGLFTTDHTGMITFVNMPLARMHGLEDPEEMIGRHFSEFVSPECRTEALNAFKKAVEEESYSEVAEFSTVKKDGSIIFVQLKHGPVIRNGRIVGTTGVIRDVTERTRAEQALAASEKKYRAIVENMSDVVYVIDPTGKIIFITPSATRLLGYDPSEVIGHNIKEFTYQEDFNPALNNIMHAVSDKKIISNEYRLVRKDGGIFWMQTFTRPLFKGDDVVAVQGAFWDITERKLAEEALKASERKFRELITNMREVLYTMDRNGLITFVSPSVESMSRYRESEMIGHHLEEFIFKDDLPRLYQNFQNILSGTDGAENEYRLVTKSGEIRWMSTRSSPLYNGAEIIGIQGILSDITERKRAEQVLRRSHEELELLVGERTAELERTNQELQNFTFSASHDLQEPLRKIQTFCDLLATRCSDSVGEQGRDYIKRMHETASRMRDVLQSLMKYSRLTSKAEPFGRVDLNEIAREVISDLELRILDTGALVEVDDLPEIEADAGQMRQLFQNLLGNALKFRREGVRPRIRIQTECSPDRECEICLSDNGIGFEEKYLERIFKPFYRLHGKDKYGGVGMGLAICAKVVEHHNGRITARSTPGKGSTFIVTLPMKQISK